MRLRQLNVGFSRTTSIASEIKCEMIGHYFFYRIGLQFGLWWLLAARTGVELAIKIPSLIFEYTRLRAQSASRRATKAPSTKDPAVGATAGAPPESSPPSLSAQAKPSSLISIATLHATSVRLRNLRLQLGYLLLNRAVRPLCETLVAAVALCIAYWFGCLVYYRIDIGYSARLYLWHFVKDVFGQCANSGFGEVWGYACLS